MLLPSIIVFAHTTFFKTLKKDGKNVFQTVFLDITILHLIEHLIVVALEAESQFGKKPGGDT